MITDISIFNPEMAKDSFQSIQFLSSLVLKKGLVPNQHKPFLEAMMITDRLLGFDSDSSRFNPKMDIFWKAEQTTFFNLLNGNE